MLIHCRHYFDFIPCLTECRLQKLEMDRRHLRAENRVILTHLFSKCMVYLSYSNSYDMNCFSFLSSIAAIRERIRIRAAPRLFTSSIFKAV